MYKRQGQDHGLQLFALPAVDGLEHAVDMAEDVQRVDTGLRACAMGAFAGDGDGEHITGGHSWARGIHHMAGGDIQAGEGVEAHSSIYMLSLIHILILSLSHFKL